MVQRFRLKDNAVVTSGIDGSEVIFGAESATAARPDMFSLEAIRNYIVTTLGTMALANAVATSNISDSAVTTAKIADGNVTLAKIANISNATVLGNRSGSAAAPAAITITQLATDMPNPAASVKGTLALPATAEGKYYKDDGTWDTPAGGGGGGSGDVVGPSSSVDNEIALYSGTSGDVIKRATTTGILKATSGVIAAAVSGTDYAPATSGTSLLKGNGSGGFAAAVSATDYAPATTGSAILKANGAGGFAAAVAGTDYVAATSGSAIQKANGSGGLTAATAGTDYAPATSGSGILKGDGSGGFAAAVSGTDYAPATATSSILKGNGSGGFSAAGVSDGLVPSGGTTGQVLKKASNTNYDVEWGTDATSGGGGGGDVTGPASVTNNTIALWDGTSGDTLKEATTTGILKAASGVLSAAVSGTDYAPATSGSAILKGNGSGGFSNAVASTDYAPATSGSAILKGNGSGGFSSAVSGTDYAPATATSSVLKGNGSGGFSAATAADLGIADSGSYFSTDNVEAALQYLGAAVAALDTAEVQKGGWDASAGTFPGSGAAQAGWKYHVTVAGTVDGVAFTVGDRLVAILDNASTSTYASNWFKLDYTDAVSSVAGRTGAVTLAVADITDMSADGRSLVSAANYAAMKALLDLEIGTDVQAYDADLTTLGGLSKTDGNFIVADGSAWTVESGNTARTSLGVGTGDSPQFTAVNLGHASDTPITRVSTGIIAVAGVNVATNSISLAHIASQFLGGHATALAGVTGGGAAITPDLQLHGTGGGAAGMIARYSNDAAGPRFVMAKSRGTSINSYTVGQNGDVAGEFVWAVADGTDLEPLASFRAEVDGTPGAGDMPGRFVWALTADGAEAATDRMALNAAGLYVAGVIDLGNTSDTTLSRSSAGVAAIEGETIHTNSTSRTLTAGTIELGHATANTLSASSGVLSVEGVAQMRVSGNQVLTGGFRQTAYNLGTITSGTTTPDAYNGNYQYLTWNATTGTVTIAAPANDCAIDILWSNNSTGTLISPTFSGFTAPSTSGDTFATTNNNKYLLMIRRINGTSTFAWKALQ